MEICDITLKGMSICKPFEYMIYAALFLGVLILTLKVVDHFNSNDNQYVATIGTIVVLCAIATLIIGWVIGFENLSS